MKDKILDAIAWIVVGFLTLGAAALLAGILYLLYQVGPFILIPFGIIAIMVLSDWALDRIKGR